MDKAKKLQDKKKESVAKGDYPIAPMPQNIKPMLAKLTDAPFDGEDWIYELKWDGYRAIAEVNEEEINLYSRNGNSYKQKYKPIVQGLKELGHQALLDGEIVVLNQEGKPDFQLLQNYMTNKKDTLRYYVFDLLYLNGYEMFDLPLVERKNLLKEIVTDIPKVIYSDHITGDGISFFKVAQENSMEGIVAKRADSRYHRGKRSNEWLKIKTSMRQEAVIGGFTAPRGSREKFGALVLGVYKNKKLHYIGHTGGGFNSDSLKLVMKKLAFLIRNKSPFEEKIRTNSPVTWVEPKLVCEVSFSEWTVEGNMRHPIFQGMREDKTAIEVVREGEDETLL